MEVILIGNLKEKHPNIFNKEGEINLGVSGRDAFGSNRRKKNSLVEDDYIRAERNDVVVEDFNNLVGSRMRKNSVRKSVLDSPFEEGEDFSY